MFDISAQLASIPDPFKPKVAIAIGAFMLVFIVLLHGAGLHKILVEQRRAERRLLVEKPHVIVAFLLFGGTVFCMLALHLAEVTIWAFVLNHAGLIERGDDAIYFCANAYTTLGYGIVPIALEWRNITPIIGISGLFTFAWTTSSLVAVVAVHRQIVDQLEDEYTQEMRARSILRKNEWDVLKKANARRVEEQKIRARDTGVSFFQRLRRWREEAKTDQAIQKSALAEIKELRRRERQDEEQLIRDAAQKEYEDKK